MSEPRGRLRNAKSFQMPEMLQRQIEKVVAYREEGDELDSIEIIGFKMSDTDHWHRFFLDAGIGFWEELPVEDVFRDFEDLQRINVGGQWPVTGNIIAAHCIGDANSPSRFEWRFDTGLLCLSYKDESDPDSESATLLSFKEEPTA